MIQERTQYGCFDCIPMIGEKSITRCLFGFSPSLFGESSRVSKIVPPSTSPSWVLTIRSKLAGPALHFVLIFLSRVSSTYSYLVGGLEFGT